MLHQVANLFFMGFVSSMMNAATNAINFRARFIQKVPIQKYNSKTQSYEPLRANFVEVDPKNSRDIDAVCNISETWKGQLFAGDIANRAEKIERGELSEYNNKIYLLTTQKKKLHRLDDGKILGAMLVERKLADPDEIRYFQVKPTLKYGVKNRKYTHVGEAMLESVKQIYNKAITLFSSAGAVGFYQTHGFKLIDPEVVQFIWRNKNIK